jgi:predicted transposase/invertase (TIGR01784 family)
VFDEDKTDSEVFHHEVKLIDIKTNKVFLDKLTYVYLEMPKFDKAEEELSGHFEKWLYVLKNLNQLTGRPQRFQERVFSKLFREAEISAYDEKEYAEYEDSLKTYRDLKNSVDTAYDDGKAEGKVEVDRNMKSKGLPVADIAELTGLNIENIEAL